MPEIPTTRVVPESRAPVAIRQGGHVRVLLSAQKVGATAAFTATLTLSPGERHTEHYHPYSDEFLYVTRGHVSIAVDGVSLSLSAGDSLMIRRGARHAFRGEGSKETHIVFTMAPLAPRPCLGQVDTEPVPFPEGTQAKVGELS